MAQAQGPCTRWKAWAKLSGSAFRMKLTSPCRQSVTCLLRWCATARKPSWVNSASSAGRSGPVNSTNSKPSVPIGLASEMTPASGVRSGGMSMDVASLLMGAGRYGPARLRREGHRTASDDGLVTGRGSAGRDWIGISRGFQQRGQVLHRTEQLGKIVDDE